MSRTLAALAVAFALFVPFALAHHTPPASDKVDGGEMRCEGDRSSGAAVDSTLPLLRTTDNGHLVVLATGHGPLGARCEFAVVITGYSLPGGVNPQGGLANVASVPCFAGGSCQASASADWWVTFTDPVNGVFTPEIDVHFDLLVNGVVVDSGVVRIVEPSVPALPGLALP